jgi:hypothetical protein
MDHDNYDDGLVHGHRWATEPTMPQPSAIQKSDDALSAAPTLAATTMDAGYDEGLIHGHAWAVTAPER